jgi:cell division protease FtsH
VAQQNRVAALLGSSRLIRAGSADVTKVHHRTKRRRVLRLVAAFALIDLYLWYRYASGNPVGAPSLPENFGIWLPLIILFLLFAVVLILPLSSGRSPHILIQPEHIDVGLEDVKGLDPQVDEVIRTLNVFLGYATFREVLGGNPRRGVLFEGPPGTGKTYLAKAMAKQAGVPFLFVSAPAFQSMWYGMTNVRIRSFFRALRKVARTEGGAIGFIEELDAIGGDRGSVAAMSPAPDGSGTAISRFVAPGGGGIVNELLIQMQSFDQPPARQRATHRIKRWINGYLPDNVQIRAGRPAYHNILLIAATNRADSLDRALMRPGRFDRQLYFDLPTMQLRRDLIDFFLDRKAHAPELDDDAARDRLGHDTFGYSPVMIEHLFDEALLVALREGRDAMETADVYRAKLTEEVGLSQEVPYTAEERRAVATHEAGHAVVAYLLGKSRRMEILSIIKRRASLGLLAHRDLEERFTKTRSEMESLLEIALGGMAAEELFFGESGTGPGADLAQATEIAATMVGALGMEGSLISYDAVSDGVLSRNLVAKVLADPIARRRVDTLLSGMKERSKEALGRNRDLVEALRDELIARDELVGDEILEAIEQARRDRDVTQQEGGPP